MQDRAGQKSYFSKRAVLALGVVGLTLAGCASSGGSGSSAMAQRQAIFDCLDESGFREQVSLSVEWAGSSAFGEGNSKVRLNAGGSVTEEFAASINVCADRKLATSESTVTPERVARAVSGKLPLPTEYPLLPGDAELWPSLTLEEQQRAIEFLKSGSSIRSSLLPD